MLRLRALGASISLLICALVASAAAARPSMADLVAMAQSDRGKVVASLPGVTPARVRGLVQVEAYHDLCVWKCLVFLGPKDGDPEAFPAVIIHQPFAVDADTMLDAFLAAKDLPGQDGVTSRKPRRDIAGRPDYRARSQAIITDGDDPSMLVALENGGVSLIVELYSSRSRDIDLRSRAFSLMASGVTFDAAAIRRSAEQQDAATAEVAAALDQGLQSGAPVRIYTRIALEWGLTPGGLDGMATAGYNAERQELILLPGGIALEKTPKAAFDSLSMSQIFGSAAPTRWTESGGAITLTRDDGSRVTLRKSGDELRDPENDSNWKLAPSLSSGDLPGHFVFSSLRYWDGGDSGANVAAANNGELRLARDGRYQLSRSSVFSASMPGAVSGNRRNGGETGRWSFDPKSYTLTLAPNGGRPYKIPAFKRAEGCKNGECLWTLLGEHWRRGR